MTNFAARVCRTILAAALLCTASVKNAAADAATAIAQAGVELLTVFTVNDAQIADMAWQSIQQTDAAERLAQPGSIYAQRAALLAELFRTVNGAELNFKVYLKDEVNAFASPDGSIRIYSGLMDRMNEDELIWVAGHEIGHIVRGHILQQFKLAYSVRAARGLVSIGDSSGIAASELGGLFEQAVNAQFSQQHEYEADDTGILLLESAGRNPQSAVSALEKIAALSSSGHNAVVRFISTHPASSERARRLRNRLAGY